MLKIHNFTAPPLPPLQSHHLPGQMESNRGIPVTQPDYLTKTYCKKEPMWYNLFVRLAHCPLPHQNSQSSRHIYIFKGEYTYMKLGIVG